MSSSIFDISGAATTLYQGQTVDASCVLVKYTYAGDANLDGRVTGDDYSAADFNILVPGASGWVNGDFNYDGVVSGDDYSAIDFSILVPGAAGWVNGDFNYDGVITGDDYSAIDFNILAQGAPFSTGAPAATAGPSGFATAVPEPASMTLLAFGAVVRLRRCRRRT